MTTDPRSTAAPRVFSFLACVIHLLASIMPGTCASGQESKTTARENGSQVKSHPSRKKKSTPAGTDDASPATPKPKPATDADSDVDPKKQTPVTGREESPLPPAKAIHAPAATIDIGQLADFAAQTPAVQQLISAALELTKMNLTYTYGSSDPASGGMDCSGTIYHLLRSRGFKDVPRDSSSQYIWARQRGQFFAVVSTEADGFEFQDLQPGDLMFWSGTYQTSRTIPISHVMLYLGREKASGKRVMFGSSDGRSYNGIQRWGVSVFDFKMPKMDPAKPEKHVDFVGYAHIPALRGPSNATIPAPKIAIVTASTPAPVVSEETPSPQETPAPVPPPSDALREPPRGSPERKAIMDALRAAKFPGKSNEVIFQVQSLKVHCGWAWAQVTPQTPGGKVVAGRILALLHLEEGQWKTVDLGDARVHAKAGDSFSQKGLVEMFPGMPADILPKLPE